MKIHPVFHVSLLKPYKDSTIPGRLQAPPPIEVDGAEEFEVSEILDLTSTMENWSILFIGKVMKFMNALGNLLPTLKMLQR